MEMSMRKMMVVLAIVLSFTAAQAAWAQSTLTVENGTIRRIGTKSIDVASNGTIYTFYDIPFSDLAIANIYLNVGDMVSISAYVVTFPNGMVKNIAFSITKGDLTYTWHPNVPKAGTPALSATATTGGGCACNNCYCACPEGCQNCSCECLCDCACDGTGPKGPKGKEELSTPFSGPGPAPNSGDGIPDGSGWEVPPKGNK